MGLIVLPVDGTLAAEQSGGDFGGLRVSAAIGHRSRFSGIRRSTVEPSAWSSTLPAGGQQASIAVPTVRLHMMHAISATKTVILFVEVVVVEVEVELGGGV